LPEREGHQIGAEGELHLARRRAEMGGDRGHRRGVDAYTPNPLLWFKFVNYFNNPGPPGPLAFPFVPFAITISMGLQTGG